MKTLITLITVFFVTTFQTICSQDAPWMIGSSQLAKSNSFEFYAQLNTTTDTINTIMYTVYQLPDTNNPVANVVYPEYSATRQYNIIVPDLKSSTNYEMRLAFYNQYGSSPETRINFTTDVASGISETDLQKVRMFVTGDQLSLTLPESLQNKPIIIRNITGQSLVPTVVSTANQSINIAYIPHGICLVSIGDQFTRKIIW